MSGSSSSFTMYIPLFLILHSFTAIDMYRQKRFSKEEVCREANASLVIVQSCPENDIIYQERSKTKMCETYPKCLGEPLVYHCVRSKENLVEVCAPNGPILGSCCAVFDRGVGRVVEDYTSTCKECPFKYQSVDCRNYSSCLETNNHLNQSINQTTTTYSTNHLIDAGSNQNIEYHTETTSQTVLIIILATSLPAAILLGCLIIIFRFRHHIKGISEVSSATIFDIYDTDADSSTPHSVATVSTDAADNTLHIILVIVSIIVGVIIVAYVSVVVVENIIFNKSR